MPKASQQNRIARNVERPERTREHYIEALGRNHVERFILLRGHASDEPRPDYGYDMVIITFDYHGDLAFQSGAVENGAIYVQLKSTDRLKVNKRDRTHIAFSIQRRHAIYWMNEPMPVILIVYSVADNRAYWLHMQPYLRSDHFKMPPPTQETLTVHLPTDNIVDENAIERFRGYKSDVLTQIEGYNLYG